jgi:hypothetical protein
LSDEATLYVIPGSHPARTGQLMLELKGIPYRRVNLVPGFHRVGSWSACCLRVANCSNQGGPTGVRHIAADT